MMEEKGGKLRKRTVLEKERGKKKKTLSPSA